jgi:hypothetical protein
VVGSYSPRDVALSADRKVCVSAHEALRGLLAARSAAARLGNAPGLLHTAFQWGGRPETALLSLAAAVVTGLFLGCVLTATYASAAMSRSQERMQRKVRYFQGEAARARQEAERLQRLLDARRTWREPPSERERR